MRFSPDVEGPLSASDLATVVTGAGGWLGRATLEMLDHALGPDALGDRVAAFASSRRTLELRSGTRITVEPLADLASRRELRDRPHLVAHYAFLTRERVGEMPLASYVSGNRTISDAVAAHLEHAAVSGAFVPSSGAVYDAGGELADDLQANPYGALKVADERRFLALGERTRSPVVVFRVFNLAGPFLNKPDRYALGSILIDVARGGPITLRADHPVVRSYVHVRDVVDLAFAAMLGVAPAPSEPIDTAGEREVEVGELARLAAAVLGRPDVPVERPAVTGPADRYVGDGAGLAALAASIGVDLAPLEDQIADTAAYLGIGPGK